MQIPLVKGKVFLLYSSWFSDLEFAFFSALAQVSALFDLRRGDFMEPSNNIPIIMMFAVLLIVLRRRNRIIVKKVINGKKIKGANTEMKELAERFEKQNEKYGVDNSIHYRFINELRYVEIALMRRQFVWADIALNNARQLLLAVETVAEGKKLHQFKAYNSLEKTFLDKLEGTYPYSREYEDIHKATESLLNLYLETIKKSDYLKFDEKLLCLLGCFE